jgi:PAS domain S-box-containing protein
LSTSALKGPEAIIAHSPAGEILEWNSAAAHLYGWTQEEAFGQDIFQLIPSGFPEPLEDVLNHLEAHGTWSGLLIQRSKEHGDVCVNSRWRLEDGLIIQTCELSKTDGQELSVGPLAGCLLDTYPGSVYLFDLAEYRTVFLHGQQFPNLGYSHDEINAFGKDLMPTLLHPEDLALLPSRMAEYSALAKGETHCHVHRVRARDGSWRKVSTTSSVFAWDVQGNPSHLVGFAVDVTDDMEAERNIRLLQDQVQFSLSATGMIAWIWEFATGDVFRLGDVRNIYGSLEPNADAFFRAVHPDDWHLSEESNERAKHGNPMEGVQMRIIRTDGQVRWIEERGTIQYDRQGNPTHMVGVTIDVTDQRRKEELSRRTHRSLRLALQAARASTWQWDCLTNLIVVSDDAFELFGLPRGAPPTMPEWLQRIHPEDRNFFMSEAKKTAHEGMDLCIDFRVVMPDGRIKPVRAVAQRATDLSGNATEVIGIVMDLSIFRGLLRSDDDPDAESWAA